MTDDLSYMCEHCKGIFMRRSKMAHRRKFCSPACRQAAWRGEKREMRRAQQMADLWLGLNAETMKAIRGVQRGK